MISYDDDKRIRNLEKHGIDLTECEEVFDHPMITKEDTSESYGEQRLQSLGLLKSRVVFIVWVDDIDYPRIISVRETKKHEQRYYYSNIC